MDPISIDGFFAFVNGLFKVGDSPASFQSWKFYKERVLTGYGEEELSTELLPVASFGELVPGSRIFWVSSLISEERSPRLTVKIEVIFNIGSDGQTKPESINIREVGGVGCDKPEDKQAIKWLWDIARGLIGIIIRLISELISGRLSGS